jgi:hypothetical protein
MSQALVKIVGGLIIVVVSFAATTYLLNWWVMPYSSVATTTAGLTGQNLLWPSQDLANPKWARAGIPVVVPDPTNSPTGGHSVFRLIESTDNGRHFIGNTVDKAVPGRIHTFSVYFQSGDRPLRLEMGDAPKGKYGTASCDLSADGAGSISKGGDVVSGAVESSGDGWYRCWAAMPYDLSTVVLNIELRSKDGVAGYQGDGQSGAVIWGPQFETGDKPTRYVPTSTGPIANAG